MQRRRFLAVPAAVAALGATAPARAFRTEEASFEFMADLEASCTGPEPTHDAIRAMVERVAAGGTTTPAELRALSACPFCQCRVYFADAPPAAQAPAPLPGPRNPR